MYLTSQDESCHYTGSTDVLKEKSKIFGVGSSNKTITKWQAAVNDEAYKLAMEDPALVLNRGN